MVDKKELKRHKSNNEAIHDEAVDGNGTVEQLDVQRRAGLKNAEANLHIKAETGASEKTSLIAESMKERLLLTVKSVNGLRSKVSQDKVNRAHHKKSEKKVLPTIELPDTTIKSQDTHSEDISDADEVVLKHIKRERTGEPVWGTRDGSSSVLLFNSGVDRSPAPSPEVSPSAAPVQSKAAPTEEVKHGTKRPKYTPILPPPRIDSLANLSRHEKQVTDQKQQSLKTAAKHKVILPPTRGLKHSLPNSPARPILPPIKLDPDTVKSVPNRKHELGSKKRPLSISSASDSSEPTRSISKRRRKVSFQGSPITPDDKADVMLTEQEEWEVTSGKLREIVSLADEDGNTSEVTDSKYIPWSFSEPVDTNQ